MAWRSVVHCQILRHCWELLSQIAHIACTQRQHVEEGTVPNVVSPQQASFAPLIRCWTCAIAPSLKCLRCRHSYSQLRPTTPPTRPPPPGPVAWPYSTSCSAAG